jgi:hypothetical protein
MIALIGVVVVLCAAFAVWYFSPYQRCIRLHGTSEYAKLFCGHVSN